MVAWALMYKDRGERGDEQEAVKWLEHAKKTTKDPKLRKEIHEILYAKRKDSGINWAAVAAAVVGVAVVGNALSGDDNTGRNSSESDDQATPWEPRIKPGCSGTMLDGMFGLGHC